MSTSYSDIAMLTPVGAVALPARKLSAEEYLSWVLASECRAEWVDGDVVVMSPSNWEHTLLRRWLDGLLSEFVESNDLGVVGDDTLLRLAEGGRYRIPDIFFVSKPRVAIIQPTPLAEPPDLVVEIVSPDSAARDWREKYLEYEAFGVREYWVIDPTAGSGDFYQLGPNGRYQPLPVESGVVRSTVIQRFWLHLAWLAPKSRPSKAEALAQIKGAS